MKRIRLRFPGITRWELAGAVLAVLALTGCVSKAKARADARAAYMAGQQDAMRRQQTQGPTGDVRINGQVQIPVLPWVNGMTLAKALVTAEYTGPEPTQIVVLRNGIANRVDVKKLLAGEDVPLQAGDVVQIDGAQAGAPQVHQ